MKNVCFTQPVSVEGYIVSGAERENGSVIYEVEVKKVYFPDALADVSGRVLLTALSGKRTLIYGDRIRVLTKLTDFLPAQNTGGFSAYLYYTEKGIYKKGFIKNADSISLLEGVEGNEILRWIAEKKEGFEGSLKKVVLPENSGIIKALIFGERGEVKKSINDDFINSGTVHILSISGLHLGIVLFMTFQMFNFVLLIFGFKKYRDKTAFSIAVAVSFFYLTIASFPVSAIRSFIMVGAFLFAAVFYRDVKPLNSFYMALSLILVASPVSIKDISFQLTFASVLGLIFVSKFSLISSENFQKSLIFKGFKWIFNMILISVAAFIFTAPISAYYFNQATFLGLFFNIAAVPLTSCVVVPFSLMSFVFHNFFPSFSEILLKFADFFLFLTVNFIALSKEIKWLVLKVPTPSFAFIISYFTALISFFLPLRLTKRLVICVSALFVLILSLLSPLQGKDELVVSFLSVGQGDSAMVKTKDEVILIDGGGTPFSSFDVGEKIIAKRLWYEGITRIDRMIVSHPHPDHIEGLNFILKNFRVDEIYISKAYYLSPLLEEFLKNAGMKGIKVNFVEKMEIVNLKGGGILKLYSAYDKPRIKSPDEIINYNCLVARLLYKEESFLFTGDINIERENEMIARNGFDLTSKVLKAAHHGSRTSSSDLFIDAVSPQYVVFSAGYQNRFKFPKEEIVERFEKKGVKTYRTDIDGEVSFIYRDGILSVKRYWE